MSVRVVTPNMVVSCGTGKEAKTTCSHTEDQLASRLSIGQIKIGLNSEAHKASLVESKHIMIEMEMGTLSLL